MVWNCLVDGFPDNYKGYKINTDFRVGVLISLLFDDEEVQDDIKILKAFDLLYKDEVPEPDVAYDGVMWFLSCGSSELVYDDTTGLSSKVTERLIDYNYDALDIWGGFWSKGVDLEKTKMHWFKFVTALQNLGDCNITQKINYRSMDLSGMKGDVKKQYSELKSKVKARRVFTREEAAEIVKARQEEEKRREENLPKYYIEYRNKLRERGVFI